VLLSYPSQSLLICTCYLSSRFSFSHVCDIQLPCDIGHPCFYSFSALSFPCMFIYLLAPMCFCNLIKPSHSFTSDPLPFPVSTFLMMCYDNELYNSLDEGGLWAEYFLWFSLSLTLYLEIHTACIFHLISYSFCFLTSLHPSKLPPGTYLPPLIPYTCHMIM